MERIRASGAQFGVVLMATGVIEGILSFTIKQVEVKLPGGEALVTLTFGSSDVTLNFVIGALLVVGIALIVWSAREREK